MAYTKDRKFIGKMFDEISPTYDRLNHLLSGMQDKKWRKQAVNYLGKQNPRYEKILDLASGSGDLAKKFLRLYFRNIPPLLGKLISKNDYAYDYLFKSVDNFISVFEYSAILEEIGFKIEYSKNNFLGIVNTVIAVKPLL